MKEKVLQAMREFGAPVNAGKIAEITGIDRKEVDKALLTTQKKATPSREYLLEPSLKTCPTTGAVHVASSPRRNSQGIMTFHLLCF